MAQLYENDHQFLWGEWGSRVIQRVPLKALFTLDKTLGKQTRTLEFCCSEDSIISTKSKYNADCNCIRLTKNTDMTVDGGMVYARRFLNEPCLLLMVSIPCIGGCHRQQVNVRYPGVVSE